MFGSKVRKQDEVAILIWTLIAGAIVAAAAIYWFIHWSAQGSVAKFESYGFEEVNVQHAGPDGFGVRVEMTAIAGSCTAEIIDIRSAYAEIRVTDSSGDTWSAKNPPLWEIERLFEEYCEP